MEKVELLNMDMIKTFCGAILMLSGRALREKGG